jgi:hypothetical protein
MKPMNDGSINIKRSSSGASGDIAIRKAMDAAYDERRPEPSDGELAKIGDDADFHATFGFDAKVDSRTGKPIQQGIGAPGRENLNHFQSILRYRGRAEYDKAVREIWKRDPKHAEKIGLEPPARASA